MNKLLLDALRKGGFILYSKHAEATIGNDLPHLNFQNCLTQRNLSEMGRRQAIYYGDILKFLKIPISNPVTSSPFCRNIETGQLAFGSGNVQVDPWWVNVYRLNGDLPSGDKQIILSGLQTMLESKPPEGKNNIIIAHSFPVGIGLGQIPDMGTAIIKPNGIGNGYEVISQLSLLDLCKLGN